MRRDAVQEPAVMRDHERVARELEQRVFQRAQGRDVEVVGRFVEQQHVAALQQGLGQVQAAALTARQRADQFLLVLALEVEATDVGARLDLDAVDVEDVRSEEHTSELQSLMRISYAVFCLKKKNSNTMNKCKQV